MESLTRAERRRQLCLDYAAVLRSAAGEIEGLLWYAEYDRAEERLRSIASHTEYTLKMLATEQTGGEGTCHTWR